MITILALNPNYKTAYAEETWAEEFYKDGLSQLEKLVSFK